MSRRVAFVMGGVVLGVAFVLGGARQASALDGGALGGPDAGGASTREAGLDGGGDAIAPPTDAQTADDDVTADAPTDAPVDAPDDASDGSADAGVPLACDGALCDTTNGSAFDCTAAGARDASPALPTLGVGLAVTALARRRPRRRTIEVPR